MQEGSNINSVKSRAQIHHETQNSSVQVLLSMAVGIRDKNEQEIANFETEEPFVSAPRRRLWKPTNKMHLTPEMHRRWSILKIGRKPGSQWAASDVMDWLRTHPIDDDADVTYIEEKVAEFKTNLHENALREGMLRTKQANHNVSWSGAVPYLRLIHCLVDHEDIRRAFEQSLGTSPQSRPIVYDLLANKWNDENYNPVTVIYPLLHDDFSKEINIGYAQVAQFGKIYPYNVRNVLDTMRMRLTFIMNRWESSRVGDVIDGMKQKDARITSNNVNDFCVNGQDNRSSFLRGEPSYLLYMWQKAHEANIATKIRVQRNVRNHQEIQKVPSIIRLEQNGICSAGSSLTDHHMAVPELDTITKSIVYSLKKETENILYNTKLARINALDKMVLEIMSRIECLEEKIEKAEAGDHNRSIDRWKQSLRKYQTMLTETDQELKSLKNQG